MDEKGMDKTHLKELLERYDSMNVSFGSGRVFGSMCTSPHPFATEVHSKFRESNLGNPGLYPGTLEMEKEVINMLGGLLHLEDPNGHVLSGGTEANITAMYAAKKKGRGKKVLFPKSAHFSVMKAVRLLDLEPVTIDLDSSYRMDLSDLEDELTDDVVMVLAVAGTTELGMVDPVNGISELLNGVHLHVDAAFGGYVLPFLEDGILRNRGVRNWDFSSPGVTTLSTDPHKMGWSTIPAGCLLFREQNPLQNLAVRSPYLTSSKAYTLAGTRDSGAVAAIFALMKLLGREGYRRMVSGCMENTRYLGKRLEEIGFEKVVDPLVNVIAVHHDSPQEVQDELAEMGYFISKVADPPALRFVIMPHINKKAIDDLMVPLEKIIGRV
ncbi:MAG: tyrosine decarboxylase MfnA [Thermoplasmatota archaeon]